jgi:hypothetical protein
MHRQLTDMTSRGTPFDHRKQRREWALGEMKKAVPHPDVPDDLV